MPFNIKSSEKKKLILNKEANHFIEISIDHLKDNWTDQNWKVTYGYDCYDYYGEQIPVPNEKSKSKAWLLRNTLTALWSVLTVLSLFFSV